MTMITSSHQLVPVCHPAFSSGSGRDALFIAVLSNLLLCCNVKGHIELAELYRLNCIHMCATSIELRVKSDGLDGALTCLTFVGQTFGTPNHHPKSQPFIDHVMTFAWLDNRVWFRNYQIVEETGALAEIGPRFVLNPIKLFAGSFQGEKLWENPDFVSPASVGGEGRILVSHELETEVVHE